MFLEVDNRELATILAALRYWQRKGILGPTKTNCIAEWDIASDGGKTPLSAEEIDELCESINCEPSPLVDQLVSAMEWATAACEAHSAGGKLDYDWIEEAEAVLEAAYAAGLGPKLSAPLKRLLMAEIDNVEGDDPATLATIKDSLDSGYTPCDGFPVAKVKKELVGLIDRIGGTVPARRLLTTADWESRKEIAKHERLVEILRNTATSCHDACTGVWDKSDDGFDSLKRAAEEGLAILGAPVPEYEEEE